MAITAANKPRPTKPPPHVIPGRVTLAVVASAAGVSPMTVSYALRGAQGGGRISVQTAEHVRRIAQKLNYVPNHMARSLRQQRTQIVGVVFSDLRRDWAAKVMDGIEQVLTPAGYQPMIVVHNWSQERNKREIGFLLACRVDAIISQPLASMQSAYAKIIPPHIPHVLISDTLIDDTITPCVLWEDGPAAKKVVSHMASHGRKRIAIIGHDTHTVSAQNRFNAYIAALDEAGLPRDPRLEIWLDSNRPFDQTDLPKLIGSDHRPDAVFAMNDSLAIDTIYWLREHGLRVPEDIEISGLGDLPVSADGAAELTTIEEPCASMGGAAAQLAIELIRNRRLRSTRVVVPAGEPKFRKSTSS